MPASQHSQDEFLSVWNDAEQFPSVQDVADKLGVTISTVRQRASRIRRNEIGVTVLDRGKHYRSKSNAEARSRSSRTHGGNIRPVVEAPSQVRRWLVTAAQDDTPVSEPFWSNLMAYSRHLGAEVKVGGFTYQKGLFEDHASRSAVFAEKVRPYLIHENEMLGPLLFAAKMNILPTAVRPLSGLETYSRGAWCIFPHAKTQLASVPAIAGQHPAMVMTSGACTVPNYIEKKAGLKAEFHHSIGAVIVEVDDAGRCFTRQIGTSRDGSFQDLDIIVRNGQILTGQRVEQITWGDIHREKLDPTVAMACWGFDMESGEIVDPANSMFHTLRPRHQAFHDLLDFQARNHHRKGDHHFMFQMIAGGTDRVEDGLKACAQFLRATEAEWCKSVNVASNHNDALRRWLREADPRADPTNLPIWCHLNDQLYSAIARGEDDFDIFRYALSRYDEQGLEDIAFVPRNGSYVICQEHGGIEIGMHGDQGPNGARGTANNLIKVATRMNIGHSHSAAIIDGVYVAGLCGLLDQGYNEGPSGWSHTQIVTNADGKRTLVTIIDGKWRA
ncbi:hypothetical protein [Alterisphingorhabdus coralli]|uniref:Uncharacterized protein n=1 Tax=Alterisphingorhabdus coralli TaxID=3071408 RepID=A0AA97I2F3_9SPHN|nr:hypothetical protein [Parasphingorhabdus sp. SCSIO 66989]WOE76335.1 hypothetical protein RB602_06380 [Parasphingorhabdus sp. SCSIO 66989]